MEALKNEIEDIRKHDLFKDLQEKIASGKSVSVLDYSELTPEQKQVLTAQMEAVAKQKEEAQTAESGGLPIVSSKPGRRFGSTQKQEAEKQATHVEKPTPPSG